MSADPRLSTVLAPGGARIAVRGHAAPAGTAEGPTLVLAHGWCLAAETWDRVVAELQARRPHLRVITYDQPGHGLSTPGHDRQVSLLDLGATLREVIAETAPEGDVVLGGHSMGGMTVMALAQVAPELFAERVRGAALVGTASWLGTRRPIPGEGIAMAVLGRLPAGTRGHPRPADDPAPHRGQPLRHRPRPAGRARDRSADEPHPGQCRRRLAPRDR